jgi:SAM-dependent methyltransferase
MDCDGIARWYRFFEYFAFGRALERRRLEYLEAVADARSVLILGDGDGRFTAEFVKRNPRAAVQFVDLSSKMVELAKCRVSETAGVRFRVGDARTIALDGNYDLVVSHFFLDCFTESELAELVATISACCVPGARWLVSEFGLPAGGVGRFAARVLIRVMYFFFWVVTGLKVTRLPAYAPVLARNGFQMVRRQTAVGGLLMSELFGSQRDHGVDAGGAPGGEPGGKKRRTTNDGRSGGDCEGIEGTDSV